MVQDLFYKISNPSHQILNTFAHKARKPHKHAVSGYLLFRAVTNDPSLADQTALVHM